VLFALAICSCRILLNAKGLPNPATRMCMVLSSVVDLCISNGFLIIFLFVPSNPTEEEAAQAFSGNPILPFSGGESTLFSVSLSFYRVHFLWFSRTSLLLDI
jgi:hypothetical protein